MKKWIVFACILSIIKPKRNHHTKTFQMSLTCPNPETDNEYVFYKFVQRTEGYVLEAALKEFHKTKRPIKKQYEQAIKQKIATGDFTNPHTLESYFNNEFDYIAIDFETANNNRTSACAMGVVFVKNDKLVNSETYMIKPVAGTKFLQRHVGLHGITLNDVRFAPDFKELWESTLKHFMNKNIVFLHNASMDASILSQLVDYYGIEDANVKYACTMRIAKHLSLPLDLLSLCQKYEIKIGKHHDPEWDAWACASIASNLKNEINLDDFIETIFMDPRKQQTARTLHSSVPPFDKKLDEYPKACPIPNIVQRMAFDGHIDSVFLKVRQPDEKTVMAFYKKKIILTGMFVRFPARNDFARYLWEMGFDVDTGVSKNTDFLVFGYEYGIKKYENACEFKKQGFPIKILTEKEFFALIDEQASILAK
jgi:DNA polymerase III epsilon subunit-like protein